jgi:hypothetical protein
MLLTVDELIKIYTLLQEYPDTSEVSIYSDFIESSLVLVVEFKSEEETIATEFIWS